MAQLHGRKVAKSQPKKPRPISEELKLEMAERTKRRELLSESNRSALDRALSDAALHSHGDKKEIERLIRAGADIDCLIYDNGTRYTPLMNAVRSGRLDVCRLLMEKGANPNILDTRFSNWKNPLMLAIIGSRDDVNCGVRYGCYLGICRLMMECGIDIEARDGQGKTALMWAAEKGQTEVCKLLIERGADAGAKDNFGRSVLDFVSAISRASRIPRLIALAMIFGKGHGKFSSKFDACLK